MYVVATVMRKPLLLAVVVLVALLGIWGVSGYNRLVRLDQAVEAQWSQVENVYQRRADLVPNLVATVKGAASFEKDTLTAVTEARARVGQVQEAAGAGAPSEPGALRQYQQAQDQLGSALSRLLVVVERYPELKATASFRELQAQLEGTENRIAIERMRFNRAAQEFNSVRDTFPTVIVARLAGGRFEEKAYFKAQSGAATAPQVRF